MDTLFALMGLVSSIASLVGLSEPSSLTKVLPWWGPILWSLALFVGCVAWLIGLTSIKENNGHLVLTRMPALILGLYLVSVATLVYGIALLIFAGWTAAVAALIMFATSGGTYLRRVDFASRFRGEDVGL
jgi:purine-cytosine permease-like protein